MNYIKLEQKEKGLFWEAFIEGDLITYKWGHSGSDKIQTKLDVGKLKNIGKANEVLAETNALQKAVLKAIGKTNESGYEVIESTLNFDDYVSKERKEIHCDIPKPMLAHTLDDKQFNLKISNKTMVMCQPKIDGYRMLFNRFDGNCYSRSRKLITSVPHLSSAIIEACKDLPDTIEWIDGEIYSDEVTFSQLQSILGKKKEIDKEVAKVVYYNVFDVISGSKVSERQSIVKAIKESNYVRIVSTEWINATMEIIKEKHGEFVENGYEGIMIRLDNYNKGSNVIDLPYESKRSYGLFKFKQFFENEYIIVGSESESVSYQGQMYEVTKTVTLKNESGDTFKARPKMNVIDRAKLWNDRESIIGKLGKVKYQELSEYNIPRFPILLSIREDFDL